MTTRTSPCEAGRWLTGPIRNMILLACSDMEKEGNMDPNLAWRYGILQRLTRWPGGGLGILYSVFGIQVT